jgi:hypothetical protein
MNFKDVKLGMKVRVGNSISITHSKFDSCDNMRRMKGKVYEVKRLTTRDGVRVRGDDGTWTFCPEDLSPLTLHKKPKPVTFDPKNL